MNVYDRSGFRRLGVFHCHFGLKGRQEEVLFMENLEEFLFSNDKEQISFENTN